jgi:hypothetical protein
MNKAIGVRITASPANGITSTVGWALTALTGV